MTRDEYRTLTLKQMQARLWRTARAIETGHARIAPGVKVKIIAKRKGLTLQAAYCRSCCVAWRARRCRPEDVDEITE